MSSFLSHGETALPLILSEPLKESNGTDRPSCPKLATVSVSELLLKQQLLFFVFAVVGKVFTSHIPRQSFSKIFSLFENIFCSLV